MKCAIAGFNCTSNLKDYSKSSTHPMSESRQIFSPHHLHQKRQPQSQIFFRIDQNISKKQSCRDLPDGCPSESAIRWLWPNRTAQVAEAQEGAGVEEEEEEEEEELGVRVFLPSQRRLILCPKLTWSRRPSRKRHPRFQYAKLQGQRSLIHR